MIPICPMDSGTFTCDEKNCDGSKAYRPLQCPRDLVCQLAQVLNKSTCQMRVPRSGLLWERAGLRPLH
jgi:hypothetical protein